MGGNWLELLNFGSYFSLEFFNIGQKKPVLMSSDVMIQLFLISKVGKSVSFRKGVTRSSDYKEPRNTTT